MDDTRPRLALTGRVVRDGDSLVCECDELHQTTWGESLELVLQDAVRMVHDYLDACRKAGSLAAELGRLGIVEPAGLIVVRLTLDVREVLRSGAGSAEQRFEFVHSLAS